MTGYCDVFHSQSGEDKWLYQHFHRKEHGFFVEVGAYDGVHLSNTLFFANLGWQGILVEPEPEAAQRCREARKESTVYECAVIGDPQARSVEFFKAEDGLYSTATPTKFHLDRLRRTNMPFRKISVPAQTLDSILEDEAPEEIDFVSIDVEEGEEQVLQGFTLGRWEPGVIVIENNHAVRTPWTKSYFRRDGYRFSESIGVNDIYVRTKSGTAAAYVIDLLRYVHVKKIALIKAAVKSVIFGEQGRSGGR